MYDISSATTSLNSCSANTWTAAYEGCSSSNECYLLTKFKSRQNQRSKTLTPSPEDRQHTTLSARLPSPFESLTPIEPPPLIPPTEPTPLARKIKETPKASAYERKNYLPAPRTQSRRRLRAKRAERSAREKGVKNAAFFPAAPKLICRAPSIYRERQRESFVDERLQSCLGYFQARHNAEIKPENV